MHTNSQWQLTYLNKHVPISTTGLRIGRDPLNDVVLSDEQVSRHHVRVWVDNDVVMLMDEGSKNGTCVNGTRINGTVQLTAGSLITLGNTNLRVERGQMLQGAQLRANPVRPKNNRRYGMIVGGMVVLVLVLVTILYAFSLSRVGNGPNASVVVDPSPTVSNSNTLVPSATALPRSTGSTLPAFDKRLAALSVVEIEAPLENSDKSVYGSGSIIDAKGIILTNFHVVRDPDTGDKYNPNDEIFVGINSVTDRPPDRIFRARVLRADKDLDVALLQLTETQSGDILPSDLALHVLPLGDSDLVEIGERIEVIGFPGLGGDTVTLTEGIVSGFLENRTWIKTDTQIESGNSGGVALNLSGQIIGIPTEVLIDRRLNSKIGLVRPINLVRAVIEGIR